jgi:hypothetical protein
MKRRYSVVQKAKRRRNPESRRAGESLQDYWLHDDSVSVSDQEEDHAEDADAEVSWHQGVCDFLLLGAGLLRHCVNKGQGGCFEAIWVHNVLVGCFLGFWGTAFLREELMMLSAHKDLFFLYYNDSTWGVCSKDKPTKMMEEEILFEGIEETGVFFLDSNQNLDELFQS